MKAVVVAVVLAEMAVLLQQPEAPEALEEEALVEMVAMSLFRQTKSVEAAVEEAVA